MGGLINHEFLASDLDGLGISSATINIPITNFMHLSQQSGDIPYVYGGVTYYFNEEYLRSAFDVVLEQTSQRNISVAGILLVSPEGDAGELLKHPDFNGIAPYTMPNMTTIESTQCYAAALDFLAQRYSKPGMRIAHWIIHNEVDGGSHWTNMGINQLLHLWIRIFVQCVCVIILYINMTRIQRSLFLSLMDGILLLGAVGIR